MPLYSYRCEDGHEFESMSSIANRNEPKECSTCGAEAHMFIVPPQISLDPTDPAFGGTWITWERKRAKQMEQEKRLARKRE